MMSKLSLGANVASNKLNRWVEPSFGNLFNSTNLSQTTCSGTRARTGGNTKGGKSQLCSTDNSSSKCPRKRKADPNIFKLQPSLFTEPAQRNQDEPWVDAHRPRSQAELAVHKRKIEEVENWMRIHVDPKTAKGGAVLLLTGPSGCGKSATVQVLAQELGYCVQEWANPSSLSEYRPSTDPDTYRQAFDPDSRFNGFHSSSQTGLFQEFLLRANKYNRLQMAGEGGASDRKLILVEDFPNQFYRQPGSLHDILRRFVRTCRRPLVFIVSDSLSGDSSSRLLFPKDIQEELGVCNISFNPVAPTSMMKVLSRIVSIEAGKSGGKLCVPDKPTLDRLCSGSSGDIRSSINSLQFSCLTDQSLEKRLLAVKRGKALANSSRRDVTKASRGKRKSKDAEGRDEEQAIGGKDASLFLFRALGKILYHKRETPEVPEGPSLPAHLSEHHRDRLLVDPEDVVERSHMSGEFFSLYLQQNYLDFFSDVEDVARASEYLSDADFLTADWNSRSTMGEYGSSVATRGLLHSNSGHVAAGFRPLHKPNWLLVNKKYRENSLAATSLFISFCLTPVSLQTELVPYLALLSNPLRNPAQIAFIQDVAQIAFIQDVGCLSRRKLPGRMKLEALTDKDPGLLDSEEEDGGPACSAINSASGILSGAKGDQADLSLEPPLAGSQGPGTGGDLPASQPQPNTASALLEEDDLLIEEYDNRFVNGPTSCLVKHRMQVGNGEQAPGTFVSLTEDGSGEDDMAEGDLGDGMVNQHENTLCKKLQSRSGSRGHAEELLSRTGILKWGSEGEESAFSWTSCSGMYTVFRQGLEGEQTSPRWRVRKTESLNDLSNEELRERFQALTQEAELLRCELEVTSRHLEGKHEAIKILQGQAILKRATSHTQVLLQKSEERTKTLEKEVNALQWEITYNQMQFKNFEQFWEQKYARVCSENKALTDSLNDQVREVQELRAENAAVSQQCLELLAMLNVREQKAFQGTKPPSCQGRAGDQRTVLELAVLGACQCPNVKNACPCARSAAGSRKQVLQLRQELEAHCRRREEALLMADAFRIAFEQQLKRRSDHFLLQDGSDYQKSRQRRSEGRSKTSLSVAQRLRGLFPSGADITEDPTETLHKLLDLLSDKEEALAHQRKVCFMLARNTEELEKKLQTDYNQQTLNSATPHCSLETDESKSNHAETSCCNSSYVQQRAGEDQFHRGVSSHSELLLSEVQEEKVEVSDSQLVTERWS
ncbi:hypothetical protein UPYG_G00179030 [Umbra pygmaea]|uniref:Cell cycle checkpoint protein RAD17 n=1 Tax=Umbra pygmaea TaxID=75934 RepID=A0ABD0XFF5_UMBPY